MDLNDEAREDVVDATRDLVRWLAEEGQSLGIAREAMINAYDEAAASLND